MKWLTFIALFCSISFSFGQTVSIEQLRTCFDDFPENAQVAIATIENGKVTYYGFSKSNGKLEEIDNQHSLFEIGSITKVFTSTLLSSLEVANKINANTTVDKLLKIKLKNKPRISLLQLSNHTAGLPRLPYNYITPLFDPNNPYKNYGESELYSYLKNQLVLNSKPGQQSNYSNLGAGLLGYALAKSQGESFENLLEKYVLQPLNLNSTFVYSKNQRDNIVKSYDEKGNIISLWDWDVLAGAGSMISSISDLSLFVLQNINETFDFLNLTQQPTFEVNDHLKIARAWHITTSKSGGAYHWHNGATAGYYSFISMHKIEKTGFILLSTVAPSSDFAEKLTSFTFGLLE